MSGGWEGREKNARVLVFHRCILCESERRFQCFVEIYFAMLLFELLPLVNVSKPIKMLENDITPILCIHVSLW